MNKRRKWIKRLVILLLLPIILVLIVGICLYLPPVQNYIQQKASAYASEATGLDISVGRVNLYFPLNLVVRDVCVIDQVDTLLHLDRFQVNAQALPLFKGKVELDKISLHNLKVNTKSLIDGVEIKGEISQAELVSRGVDLNQNTVKINKFLVDDSDVTVKLSDTPKDSLEAPSEPINWRIDIESSALRNTNLKLQMLSDSISIGGVIDDVSIANSSIDLFNEKYSIGNFIFNSPTVTYKQGNPKETKGLNVTDIRVHDVHIVSDSILYSPTLIQGHISKLSLYEKSGLNLNQLQTNFKVDSSRVELNQFYLQTAYSYLKAQAEFPIDILNSKEESHIDLDMNISLKEVAKVLGVEVAKGNFETWGPVLGTAKIEGTKDQLDVHDFHIELSDAFSVTAVGSIFNITDIQKRQGQLDVLGDFYDLTRFDDWLSEDKSILLPKDMVLRGMVALNSNDVYSELEFLEDKATIDFTARYNIESEKYSLKSSIDSLSVMTFMPSIPLRDVNVDLELTGQYTDVLSSKATANLNMDLKSLSYDNWRLQEVDLTSSLQKEVLYSKLTSNNKVVKGEVEGNYYLNKPNLSLKYDISIDELDLYTLKLIDKPIDKEINLMGGVHLYKDSLGLNLRSEDLNLEVEIERSLEELIDKGEKLSTLFMAQLKKKDIDFPMLQALLPNASIQWTFGQDNIISSLLALNNINFQSSNATIKTHPLDGIQGNIYFNKAKIDSLSLDTVEVILLQDSTHMELKAGVVNKYVTKNFPFSSFATATLNAHDASLLLEFEEGDGTPGLLFGMTLEPFKKGLLVSLIPKNPIIAFKKFGFKDGKNKIFIRDDFRVFAEVDMLEDRSVGFKMQSSLTDTVSRQNMNIELRRLDLSEVSDLLPFLPTIGGYLSAESHYVQTESSLRLSTDIVIDSLSYENRPIGTLGLGLTWLPVSMKEHLIDIYLSHDRKDVLYADGNIKEVDGKEIIDVNASFSHFPLSIADVVFPNEEIKLSGDIDGELNFSGLASAPQINGQIILDSVSVYAKQADAYFYFDNRPVKVENSKVIFKDFSIYTTDNNPFMINGTIDISDMSNPVMDLKLKAVDYPLLNAKRTRESIVYGKVFVNVNATVTGLIDALKMRGYMSILNNTDVTYVLTESPLTVQDRLGELVTFTSFNDTITTNTVDSTSITMGGIDMVMAVHIDPSVQFKVDLSADRSSRIELMGGGDLSLQYNPQTDFSLIGRYTLSGGLIKYSLPIIPSKEFQISSDSYIEWTGKVDDPKLNLIAVDKVRASVTDPDGSSHMVNFNVIIGAKNKLDNLELVFDLEAPDDATVQNQLASMSKEDRNKQAIGLLATGVYLAGGSDGKGGLNMGAALNSVLQSQINALAGSTLKNASLSVGVEEHDVTDTGQKRTDYSFSYAQRFLNNRVQIIIGGRVKTGEEVSNDLESIIDNVSIEYRLDASGTRYIRVFHNKNYESVLEGEITETGVGLVLRKKLSRLGELFVFKKKKNAKKSAKKNK